MYGIGRTRTLEITTKIGCKPNMCEYCPQKTLMHNYETQNPTHMTLEVFKKCLIPIKIIQSSQAKHYSLEDQRIIYLQIKILDLN